MELTENGQPVALSTLWAKYTDERPGALTTWSGAPIKYCYVDATTLSGLTNVESSDYVIGSSDISYRLSYIKNDGLRYYFVGYNI